MAITQSELRQAAQRHPLRNSMARACAEVRAYRAALSESALAADVDLPWQSISSSRCRIEVNKYFTLNAGRDVLHLLASGNDDDTD